MTRSERAALAREIAAALPPTGGAKVSSCGCPGESRASRSVAATDASLAGMLDQALPDTAACGKEAKQFLTASTARGFRSICVQSKWAALAVRMLRGCPSKVAAFIGFPQATALTPTKCMEAQVLLRLGVQELTMVADIGALRSGDLDAAYIDIQAVARLAACQGAAVNVFLELPLLSHRRKAEACVVAKLAGASSVIASTGFGGSDADINDVRLMRQVVGEEMDVVAAGGVHSAAAVRAMRAAGAVRVYTSHGLEIVGDKSPGENRRPVHG